MRRWPTPSECRSTCLALRAEPRSGRCLSGVPRAPLRGVLSTRELGVPYVSGELMSKSRGMAAERKGLGQPRRGATSRQSRAERAAGTRVPELRRAGEERVGGAGAAGVGGRRGGQRLQVPGGGRVVRAAPLRRRRAGVLRCDTAAVKPLSAVKPTAFPSTRSPSLRSALTGRGVAAPAALAAAAAAGGGGGRRHGCGGRAARRGVPGSKWRRRRPPPSPPLSAGSPRKPAGVPRRPSHASPVSRAFCPMGARGAAGRPIGGRAGGSEKGRKGGGRNAAP